MYDGKKIARLREERGWSQAQLASKVSLSQPTISDLENQVTQDPGFETLSRVAAALGVPLSQILGKPNAGADDLVGAMMATYHQLDLGDQEAIYEAAKALLRRRR